MQIFSVVVAYCSIVAVMDCNFECGDVVDKSVECGDVVDKSELCGDVVDEAVECGVGPSLGLPAAACGQISRASPARFSLKILFIRSVNLCIEFLPAVEISGEFA